jgi:hypothetical protein
VHFIPHLFSSNVFQVRSVANCFCFIIKSGASCQLQLQLAAEYSKQHAESAVSKMVKSSSARQSCRPAGWITTGSGRVQIDRPSLSQRSPPPSRRRPHHIRVLPGSQPRSILPPPLPAPPRTPCRTTHELVSPIWIF